MDIMATSASIGYWRKAVRRVLPWSVRQPVWGCRIAIAKWWRMRRAVGAATIAARRPRQSNQIVFVSDRPSSREAKLAHGLRQAGWQVVLLYKTPPAFEAARYFQHAHGYRDEWEALAWCARYRPVAFHVFSTWEFDVAARLVRHRPGKIVFDDYDVMVGMLREEYVGRDFRRQVALERYCLENADGLCCRSLETQFAKRHLGC